MSFWSGSKWPMIGPRPCAYVDPVFTGQSYDISISISTRRTNLSVFLVLMLMLMSQQFSVAYTCACAYAYALVKTTLKRHDVLWSWPVGLLKDSPAVPGWHCYLLLAAWVFHYAAKSVIRNIWLIAHPTDTTWATIANWYTVLHYPTTSDQAKL